MHTWIIGWMNACIDRQVGGWMDGGSDDVWRN